MDSVAAAGNIVVLVIALPVVLMAFEDIIQGIAPVNVATILLMIPILIIVEVVIIWEVTLIFQICDI